MNYSIVSTGRAVPERALSNDDLAGMVDTNDQWIRERTGIAKRHVLTTETLTDLAEEAARKALEGAHMTPEALDLILVATFTSDTGVPSSAANVRERLGIRNCVAFDVNAACTGFVYALCTARGLMETMGFKNALVIGAETLTRVTDWSDRSTCVLFGDGAGAAIFQADAPHGNFLAAHLEGVTDDKRVLGVRSNYENNPFLGMDAEKPNPYVYMNGQAVFRFAVTAMCGAIKKVIADAGLRAEDVDWVVPHQANIRIIDFAIKKLGIPKERYVINLDRYGNTSSASIPMALDELFRSGKLNRGDKIVMAGFGGGLTAGAVLIEY